MPQRRWTATLLYLLMTALALVGCKKDSKPKPRPAKRAAKKRVAAKRPAPRKTDTIVGKEITYMAGKTKLKGYIAHDSNKKGKRPGILVVHEWWGHNDYARMRARKLAKLGYVALALDMYGEGKNTSHPKDATKFMMSVMKNIKEGEKRFLAAKKMLAEHPDTDGSKIAAIGYCFGGSIVLHMARTGLDLAGVASFHAGSLKAMKKVKKGGIKAEILVLNGAADPFIKKKSIVAFKKEMKRVGAKLKFIDYPDAKHAFTNPGATAVGKKFKLPLAYNKDADEKSWAAMKAFFQRILGS